MFKDRRMLESSYMQNKGIEILHYRLQAIRNPKGVVKVPTPSFILYTGKSGGTKE
jgi:hypothetical protein